MKIGDIINPWSALKPVGGLALIAGFAAIWH
jgi:uncharacterized membrane protein YgdD (TMEM256/DUF423 family)